MNAPATGAQARQPGNRPAASRKTNGRACQLPCAERQGGSTLIMITELEFKSLAGQGYNRIPLMAEAFAD
ncbi:MAG: hypothetical protein FWG56_08540, partial [Desulfovibrionaceae bacterium]|nr:hypothetical protein [Desulfovibrionaceae bacterium]